MNSDARRLSILSAEEVDELYRLAQFTEDDRHIYFDLSAAEHAVVTAVHTVSVAAHLTLQLGYFKAKQQFFTLVGFQHPSRYGDFLINPRAKRSTN